MSGNTAVGRLHAVMGIDTSAFDRGWDKTQKKVGKGLDFSKGIDAGLADVRRTLSSTAGAAGSLGAALGGLGLAGVAAAAAIGGGFVEVRKALAFGDEIGDTAAKLAVTTDALQEYRFTVHALGGEYTDADKALEGFSKAFGAAQAKLSAKAVKPFKLLDLDPDQFATTEDALAAVIEKISKLKSTAQQAAIADKLGIGAMLPAIREGSDEIARLRGEAHSLGQVMDAELVERAGKANDEFEHLAHSLDVDFKSAMVEISPIVMTLAKFLGFVAEQAGAAAHQIGRIDAATAVGALPVVGGALKPFAQKAQAEAQDKRGAALARSVRAAMGGDIDWARSGRAIQGGGDGELANLGKSGGGGRSAAQRAETSDAAIAQAARDELSARMALIGDISALAVLREQEVRDENSQANLRLQRDAAEGKITKAAAAQATLLNDQAAAAKLSLIHRETEAALDAGVVKSREEIGRYYDQIAGIEASLATTAQARNAVEAKALAHQQRTETLRLETDLEQEVIAGLRTESSRDALLASQRDLQAAERKALTTESEERVAGEILDRKLDTLGLQADLLESEADAHRSSYARAQVELRILELKQEEERLALEYAAQFGKTDDERAAARARLAVLQTLHANQKKVAERGADFLAAFEEATDTVGDLKRDIEAGDYAGALSEFLKAVDFASTAFGQAGNAAGKAGAVAAVAGAAGQAIGGKGGAALSGAASGAAAGAAFGLPGAVIGGLLGGIGGFLGASKAKKRAKKEAAARAKAEAEQKAAEEAAAKRTLEIELMRLGGDELGAVNAEREDYLKGLSAENAALQKEAWAKADANALVERRTELERELLRLQDPIAAVTKDRADALAAEDASLRSLLQLTYDVIDATEAREKAEADWARAVDAAEGKVDDARSAFSEAIDRDVAAMEAAADRFGALADDFHDLAEQLRGEKLASDPSANLKAAKAAFDQVAARLAAGDVSALDDLKGVAQDFSAASKGGAKTAAEDARNQAAIRRSLIEAESLARQQVDAAHAELDALQKLAEMGGLEVELQQQAVDALRELLGAVADLASVQAQADEALRNLVIDAVGQTAVTPAGPDLAAIDAAAIDAAALALVATPMVDVMSPGTINEPIDYGELLTTLQAVAVNTGQATRLFRRWDGDGLPEARDYA